MREYKDIRTEKKVSEAVADGDFDIITEGIIRDDIEEFEKMISEKILEKEKEND